MNQTRGHPAAMLMAMLDKLLSISTEHARATMWLPTQAHRHFSRSVDAWSRFVVESLTAAQLGVRSHGSIFTEWKAANDNVVAVLWCLLVESMFPQLKKSNGSFHRRL